MDVTSILIRLNLPILLDEFPMKAMGLPPRLKWICGGMKVLGAQRSRVDGLDSGDGIGFDASNQTLQEVAELKNLIGISRDIGSLGKGGCVGSVGCNAHAIGIKIER